MGHDGCFQTARLCLRELPPESVPVKIRQYMDALGVAPRTVSTAVQRRFDSCRVLHMAV